jgi:hypothetical protein
MEITYTDNEGKVYIFEDPNSYCSHCNSRSDIWKYNKKFYNFCYKKNCDINYKMIINEKYYNYEKRYNHENYDYKAYRSQYTQSNDNKPLIYSSRIYLEKVIEKYYETNEDIRNNRDKILSLNDQLENAFKQVKDPSRKNSLNVHFKLSKLLQLCDEKCDVSSFKKMKKNKLNLYNKIWGKICAMNGWKLIG